MLLGHSCLWSVVIIIYDNIGDTFVVTGHHSLLWSKAITVKLRYINYKETELGFDAAVALVGSYFLIINH